MTVLIDSHKTWSLDSFWIDSPLHRMIIESIQSSYIIQIHIYLFEWIQPIIGSIQTMHFFKIQQIFTLSTLLCKYNITSFDPFYWIHSLLFALLSFTKKLRKHFLYSSLWEFGSRSRGAIIGCVMDWIFQRIWGAQSSKRHKKLYFLLYKLGNFLIHQSRGKSKDSKLKKGSWRRFPKDLLW
jgi:hypothetical protein